MAGAALDTVEEAIGDRDVDGNVTPVALRAAEGLIKSLEKGVKQEAEGGSKELQAFMNRLEAIAEASAPKVVDVES